MTDSERKIRRYANILIDKGVHQLDWALAEAEKDLAELENPSGPLMPECSICRFRMTEVEEKYHYHPCE